MILSASAVEVYLGTPFNASLLIITVLMIFCDHLNSKYLALCGLLAPHCIPHTATPSSCKIRRGCFPETVAGTTNSSPTQRITMESLPQVMVRLCLLLSGDVELNPGPLDQGSFTHTSKGCVLIHVHAKAII